MVGFEFTKKVLNIIYYLKSTKASTLNILTSLTLY